MSKQTLLLKHYNLCKHCLERHIGAGRSSEPCYICRGLMDSLDALAKSILAAVKNYDFETFLVGAILSPQLYEREDTIRARLKIRGTENIKNHLTRKLGINLSQLTGKRVEYTKPDIRIMLNVDKESNVDVDVISRPLPLAGIYTKKSRGLPQKQDRCVSCAGTGCNCCNFSGLSGYESVEGVLAKEIARITGGQMLKFTWIGSEDQSSLVLGSGRPFYVRVFNPKKRSLKKKRIKGGGGITAMLYAIDRQPDLQPPFIVKTKIHIKCKNTLSKKCLKKLNSLSGSVVCFENKSKIVEKRIFSVRSRQIDSNQFALTIVADGGLMIKQFVGGEKYMKPNISEILGDKCECITFDILDVKLQ
jgi:tRNA pseudouridine synthase 10